MKKLYPLVLLAACTVKTGTPTEVVAPTDAPAASLEESPCGPDVPGERTVATRVEPSSATTECITRGDVDAFVVTALANKGGTVFSVTVAPSSQMAPLVELFDGDGKRLHRNGGDKGQKITSWAHVDAGTDVYVQVSQGHGESESYRLEVTSTTLEEEGEPNDSEDMATPGTVGTAVNAHLSGPANRATGLVDWYRFPVDRAGKYSVMLDIGGDIAPQLEVQDGNRKRLATKGGGRGERITAEVKITKPGDLLIKVSTGYTVEPAGKDLPPHHLTTPYALTVERTGN